MFKRNSIFIRVLIPVILVVLVQTLIISMILFVNGTIDSLESGAIESMRKNGENRAITLENMMILYWSNLDKLESEVVSSVARYLNLNSLEIDDVLGDYRHENEILNNLSTQLISSLRLTSSTGIYLAFIGSEQQMSVSLDCNGLYYRDFDPTTTPVDNSDLLFMRGHIDIARKDRIQLDSLWSETFKMQESDAGIWDTFAKPQLAAAQYEGARSTDLAYWNRPLLASGDKQHDSSKCITYSRPVFYNGEIIAVLGTEVQVGLLEKYIPANDIDNSGRSGYMLVQYPAGAESAGGDISCEVYLVTGSYTKRIAAGREEITLSPTKRAGVFTIAGDSEGVEITLQPMRLYNSHTPFSSQQWAVAAIATDSLLLEAANNVGRGIIFSSLFALVIGSVIIAIVVRYSTRSLVTISRQIENSESLEPIAVKDSGIYEVALLVGTINDMRAKRGIIESQLREERERYLIALESATDTFMEYDVAQDSFMLYYFAGEAQDAQLRSNVMPDFLSLVSAGGFCHNEDIQSLLAFLRAEVREPIEIRARAELFSHITETEPDGEYYWFLLKAAVITDNAGNAQKIIGTAKEITREKLEEYERIETSRRDSTTGLYNREYGMQLIRSRAKEAAEADEAYAVAVLHIDGFDDFETYYGGMFGGLILSLLWYELNEELTPGDIAARLSNDDFLVLFTDVNRAAAERRINKMRARANAIYMGESAELRPGLSAGVTLSSERTIYDKMLQRASLASRFAARAGGSRTVFFTDMPEDARRADPAYSGKPVSAQLDISREDIVSFVFEYFERVSDIHSAINALLPLLGRMFSLDRIVVCAFDADFSSNRVVYQWSEAGMPPIHSNIELVTYKDLTEFDSLLDENGALVFSSATVTQYSEQTKRMLCVTPGDFSSYCCVMYENGVHAGRILFTSNDERREWTEPDELSLYEITKIIAVHRSVEKSHSASRAKSEFLSRISHEIRTPMNAIIGMTEIAKSNAGDRERLSDCLEKIDFSAKYLLSLINDVLEMSRIESGKLQIVAEPFSLKDFAEGIETLMRPPIESKQIDFKIEMKTSRFGVIGDEYRLRQVIVNLLGNASKFTPACGSIVFTIEDADPSQFALREPVRKESTREACFLRFSVRDTGVGISLEEQPNIFRAFEQAGSDSTKRRQGTGLGLAISGNIISAMGSKIELFSRPGEGSEFYFTLMLELDGGEEHVGKAGIEEINYKAAFAGKRALLVEDNEINTEIATYLLHEVGLEYEIAENGQIAVDMFMASPVWYYDVVLMDIQMPVMDGLTATRNIRKNIERPDARAVPIIAMTADAFDEDMKKSIESGMNGHVAKPIDSERLYRLISQVLSVEKLLPNIERDGLENESTV